MTPTRRSGKRSKTPSKSIVASVCAGGRGCPCSRRSGSSRRRRGSRVGSATRCGSSWGRSAGRCRRRGTRSGCGRRWPLPTRHRGRRGSASASEGNQRRRAARPRPSRSPLPRARRRDRGRPAARRGVGSSRGSAEQNSIIARLWARAAPIARSRSPECSHAHNRLLWKVLKISWLAKPSRSRARPRSSAMNAPVAAKFLRAMISAASAAR